MSRWDGWKEIALRTAPSDGRCACGGDLVVVGHGCRCLDCGQKYARLSFLHNGPEDRPHATSIGYVYVHVEKDWTGAPEGELALRGGKFWIHARRT